MKTEFEFIMDYSYETMRPYKKGDKGYIDGYVQSGTRPLIVIVVGEIIDLIPFTNIIKIIPKK